MENTRLEEDGQFCFSFYPNVFYNHAVCLSCCVDGGSDLRFCVADQKYENSCPKERTLIMGVWKQRWEESFYRALR